MPPVRRLTAILAADVAGYSRLMGADEEGTHERLKAHLRELIEPKIAEHRGRVVKNTGDGFLAEFPSVVDAVRCAVEVQGAMAERERGYPAGEADRVPGRDQPGRRDRGGRGHLRRRGEYRRAVGGAGRPRRGAGLEYGPRSRSRPATARLRGFGRAAGQEHRPAGAGLCLRSEAVADLPASTLPPSMSISQPAVAPRLSIVVLPFANLSNDPEQQYFADGITEDLTTDLSRIVGMFVISRNTAFTYRNNRIDTKQIGRELGVRYVLEGSVRRSGNRVRVSAQLIDAEIDAHLWAERFDCDTEDLFALQDEIVSRLANALGIELIAAEAARPTKNPDALDYILRGRAVGFRQHSRDSYYVERISLFERALALDPLSVEAQTRLAAALVGRVFDGVSASAAADLATAQGLVGQALTTSPRYAHAHVIKGRALSVQNRWEEAIPEYEMALALNRNSAAALQGLGPVQASCWANRRGDFASGGSHSPQPPRSLHRLCVFRDRCCASAGVTHRRGNRLARKSTQCYAGRTDGSQRTRLRLRPQRRDRTRRRSNSPKPAG